MKKLFTLLSLFITLSFFAQDKIYVHTATASNTFGRITIIDHPDLNGNPDAGIVFSNSWGGNFNPHIASLWYNGSNWTIYNEQPDGADMIIGAKFNVYIGDNTNFFTHIATVANQGSSDAYTVIDHAEFNGVNPGPYAVFSRYYNPNAAYNKHNYGFWYDTGIDRRILYAEDGEAIPEGVAFKVLVNGDTNANYIEHQATIDNIDFSFTAIDDPLLNNNPNATFVFSHYWGISGLPDSVVEIDSALGAYYANDIGKWGIYMEDASDMPVGAYFDIIVAPQQFLGINENTLNISIEAYPNPTTDRVTINTDVSINLIEIYDMLGKKIETIEVNNQEIQIDLSEYQTGTYIAKIQSGNTTKSIKLIKQ